MLEQHSFQEVMRQYRRMCKANAGCVICPLCKKEACSINAFVNNPKHIEGEVMSWAAAHPEPVYPTWGEWLMQFDVMGRTYQDMPNPYFATEKAASPIPADIAQKLGIEPKEG